MEDTWIITIIGMSITAATLLAFTVVIDGRKLHY